MSKLPLASSAQMAKILRRLGFALLRRGMIRAILRDIEISPKEYVRLRKG